MGLEIILTLVFCILAINTGHFLLVQNPHMYLMAAVFSLTGYLGINFVLVLVRSFGALLAVTGTVMWLQWCMHIHNCCCCFLFFSSDYIPKGSNDGAVIFTLHQTFHISVSTTIIVDHLLNCTASIVGAASVHVHVPFPSYIKRCGDVGIGVCSISLGSQGICRGL